MDFFPKKPPPWNWVFVLGPCSGCGMLPDLACFKARRIHRSISAGKLSFPRVANGIKAAKEEFLGFFHLVFLVIHLLEKSPFWAVLWESPRSFPVLQQDPFGGGMDPALGWEALGQERNKIPGFRRRTGSFHGNSSRSSSRGSGCSWGGAVWLLQEPSSFPVVP